MSEQSASIRNASPRWDYRDLPYERINTESMAGEEAMLYFLATASFVEITTDIYTRNLIEYFAGDEEVEQWLADGWEPEEMQHGHALKRYVQTAWPDFDWEAAYDAFIAEYRECCQAEFLGPTPALEMARRCVVETGTCSYYTMIRNLSPCPVLRELSGNIRTDEAGHYKHFHDYFKRYRQAEKPSRTAITKALWGRIREIDGEDAYLAYKYVWKARHPDEAFKRKYYREFTRLMRELAVKQYPFRMAAHMMTQPLGFGLKAQKRLTSALAVTARFLARATGHGAPPQAAGH